MASSAATLPVLAFLVIVSSLGQPAAATTACRDCSPEAVCLQNCKPAEIAKCESACRGSCNTGCRYGSCDCEGTCRNNCAGAGGVCTSKCTNLTVCQSCKDKYSQQCTTYCNANCV